MNVMRCLAQQVKCFYVQFDYSVIHCIYSNILHVS